MFGYDTSQPCIVWLLDLKGFFPLPESGGPLSGDEVSFLSMLWIAPNIFIIENNTCK